MDRPTGGATAQTVTEPERKEGKMERETYTTRELADLLGLNIVAINNAKQQKPKNPQPGSAIHAVTEAMKARGITWEQVTPTPRGNIQKNPQKADAPPATIAETAPAALESDAAQAVADREPEAASEAPQAPSSEAYLLSHFDAPQAEPDGGIAHATGEARLHPLATFPLEALAGEITRRMPRAVVVLR
jgi:hypothetical protein